ncbi:MAG: hypothetical protein HY094_02730 [Candidatus Melainabacteria bacterium]|nr:hypothetical protein [Candidatus Melainabacteria bacterium]
MAYKINQEITPFQIEVDKYRPCYYAGASGDFNPIHIDNDFAKAVGLGGVILHGLCTMAYVYRAVMNNKDPEKLKKIKARFKGMVRPNDKLTVSGKVTAIENNLATIDLLATNQKNEHIITNACAAIEI